MHILSARHRSELVATPSMVRATMVRTADGEYEPTLIVKARTLGLKFLISATSTELIATRAKGGYVLYGIDLKDDPSDSALVWSPLESPDELEALKSIAAHGWCRVFAFNELAANVGSAIFRLGDVNGSLMQTIDTSVPHPQDMQRVDPSVQAAVGEARRGDTDDSDLAKWSATVDGSWTTTEILFYPHRPTKERLAIDDPDEGGQQELLGLWLMDHLTPTGVVHQPQVRRNGGNPRELIDLLMTHDNGLYLFESKAVGLLSRSVAPTREKLAQTTQKHVKKALSQLTGAMRNIRAGLPLTDRAGNSVVLPADVDVPHAIVLVADLSLLGNARIFDEGRYVDLVAEVGAAVHILDLSELLRTVQAADILSSASGRRMSAIEVFDDCLLQRAENVAEGSTFNIEMILPAGASSAWTHGEKPQADG